MYIKTRIMKMEKGYKEVLLEKFSKPSLLEDFNGFVKREILIDESNKTFDVFRISNYFISRQAYIEFESSDLHKQMHQNKQSKEKLEGLIEVTKETYYELITTYKK